MTKLILDPTLTGDTILYRYVSLETFFAFVETRQAHFRKVTEWDDPWEALLSKIPTIDDAGKILFPFYSLHQDLFGQSWSLLQESDAMWRIYSPSKSGLVISTQVHRFELLEGVRRLYVGPVVYFEQLSDLVAATDTDAAHPPFKQFCYKRDAFEHEKEVRVLISGQDVPDCDPGARSLTLPLEPVDFVDRIAIDPRAPRWLVDSIVCYCRRVGFPNEPVQSSLYAPDPHLTSGLVRRWVPVKDGD